MSIFWKKQDRGRGVGSVQWGCWFAVSNRQDREGLTKKMTVKELQDGDIQISGKQMGRVRQQPVHSLEGWSMSVLCETQSGGKWGALE